MENIELGALTIPEFSRMFGISRTKIYEEIKAGKLDARKIGTRTIVPRDAALRWARALPHLRAGEQA